MPNLKPIHCNGTKDDGREERTSTDEEQNEEEVGEREGAERHYEDNPTDDAVEGKEIENDGDDEKTESEFDQSFRSHKTMEEEYQNTLGVELVLTSVKVVPEKVGNQEQKAWFRTPRQLEWFKSPRHLVRALFPNFMHWQTSLTKKILTEHLDETRQDSQRMVERNEELKESKVDRENNDNDDDDSMDIEETRDTLWKKLVDLVDQVVIMDEEDEQYTPQKETSSKKSARPTPRKSPAGDDTRQDASEIKRHNQVMEDIVKLRLDWAKERESKKKEIATEREEIQLKAEEIQLKSLMLSEYQKLKSQGLNNASILAILPQLQPIVDAFSRSSSNLKTTNRLVKSKTSKW